MEQKQFETVLSRAQKLILDEDFNAKVEAKAMSFRGIGDRPHSDSVAAQVRPVSGGSASLLEDIMSYGGSRTAQTNSKLPKEILESFSKMPPMTDVDNTALGTMTRKLERNVVAESARNDAGGVDYSLIKSIIDESVRRNIQEMAKGLINESAGSSGIKALTIRDGNKIQFLDAKGNLYEGILKLKKRAKS